MAQSLLSHSLSFLIDDGVAWVKVDDQLRVRD